MATALDTQSVLDLVDKRISALETFALQHRLPKGTLSLPPLSSTSRKYTTTRALYNALDSSVVKIQNVADKLPRNISYGRSHIQAKVIDYDPGELFMRNVRDTVAKLVGVTEQMSRMKVNERDSIKQKSLAIVHEQMKYVELSMVEESKIISQASRMAKPTNEKVLKQQCQQLIELTTEISDLKYDMDNKCKLYDHVMVLGDLAAALGWILSPTPLKFIREYKNIIENLNSNILANYIELGCNPIHSLFAETLNHLIGLMTEYIEKEHPAGLRWNYAQGSIPLGYKRAQRKLTKFSHPIGDCLTIIDSSVTEFVIVSQSLGGAMAEVAPYIKSTFEEMCNVIEAAANKPKPKGWGESVSPAANRVGDDVKISADLKMLLMAIQNELVFVDNVIINVKSGEKFYEHCEALKEFVLCFQWTSATTQKMSPVGYIIGIENVVQLYLDKILKQYGPRVKKPTPTAGSQHKACVMFDDSDTYVRRLHAKWVQCVKNMIVQLKEYVKLHHPNELMFDTGRSRKSVDDIFRNTSVTKKLQDLKLKSSAKKWKRDYVVKTNRAGGKKTVMAWVRA